MKTTSRLILGDCLEVMKSLPDHCADCVVTDPPAGIGFMSAAWDSDKGGRDYWVTWMTEIASECLRLTKPGGHAFVWAIPRTSHWTATAWENAGWEVRDRLIHTFAQGFPKSHNLSKAIDKMKGATREKIMVPTKPGNFPEQAGDVSLDATGMTDISEPVTEEAKAWKGYGTALKPAIEDWWVFRAPLEKGLTIAENCLKHGTGALNIDDCRIPTAENVSNHSRSEEAAVSKGKYGNSSKQETHQTEGQKLGRFPANLVVQDDVLNDGKERKTGNLKHVNSSHFGQAGESERNHQGDTGSYSRFFSLDSWAANLPEHVRKVFPFLIVPKAAKSQKNQGCDGMYLLKENTSSEQIAEIEKLLTPS